MSLALNLRRVARRQRAKRRGHTLELAALDAGFRQALTMAVHQAEIWRTERMQQLYAATHPLH